MAILRGGSPSRERRMQLGYEKNRDFPQISRIILEIIQDRAIATMEGE